MAICSASCRRKSRFPQQRQDQAESPPLPGRPPISRPPPPALLAQVPSIGRYTLQFHCTVTICLMTFLDPEHVHFFTSHRPSRMSGGGYKTHSRCSQVQTPAFFPPEHVMLAFLAPISGKRCARGCSGAPSPGLLSMKILYHLSENSHAHRSSCTRIFWVCLRRMSCSGHGLAVRRTRGFCVGRGT